MKSNKDTKRHPVARSVACYFCNEFFEDNYLQNHIIQCSSVLEPCPNKKCGVYVQRSQKDKHILECQKKSRPIHYLTDAQQINSLPKSRNESIEYLETQLLSLKTSTSEERKYRLETQIELQTLHKSLRKIEDFTLQLSNKIDQLKRSNFEEFEKRKSCTTLESKLEFDKIHLQYQVIDGWQKNIDSSIEYVKNRLIENDNKLLDLEYTLKHHENRLDVTDRLELEINMVHQKVDDDQFNRQEESVLWRGELNDFKQYFTQENAMIAAVWNDHQKELNDLKNLFEMQSNSLSDFKTKYQAIIFDTKSVSQIANENSDTLESQKNEIKALKENYEQLKLDFSILRESVQQDNSLPKERLLWKIENFKSKMDSAKEHNTVLFSPSLLSSSYGYKLRLQVHLNGIKKWKGRHIIISLQVLKSDYDTLLTWPCFIEAKILLRNQDGGKNLTKSITAKRLEGNEENEDPQESSTQHIFITHSSLEKQNFINNDTLFFDINITNDNSSNCKKTNKDTNS